MIWSSNQIGTIRARRLRRLLRRADHARDQREYAEAARLYQIALALDPRRADTRLQLGQMFKELARFGEAEAAFRQVLAQSPNNREAPLQLRQLLTLLGRGEEARIGSPAEPARLDRVRPIAEQRASGVPAPASIAAPPATSLDHYSREGDRL